MVVPYRISTVCRRMFGPREGSRALTHRPFNQAEKISHFSSKRESKLYTEEAGETGAMGTSGASVGAVAAA